MLTLRYLPYTEYGELSPNDKIRKVLNIVKGDSIVLMEGRLSPGEEAQLIERTMEQINRGFKGIEICTVFPEKKNDPFARKLKNGFYKLLLGNRMGVTVIGPASIVKEIKRDPNKIELLTRNSRKRRK